MAKPEYLTLHYEGEHWQDVDEELGLLEGRGWELDKIIRNGRQKVLRAVFKREIAKPSKERP